MRILHPWSGSWLPGQGAVFGIGQGIEAAGGRVVAADAGGDGRVAERGEEYRGAEAGRDALEADQVLAGYEIDGLAERCR